MHDHENALHNLAVHIQRNPTSPESVYLRKLLWSLYDPNSCISYCRLYTRTDRARLPLVNDITTAASKRILHKTDIQRALLVAGERERAPKVRISPEVIQWSGEAKALIERAHELIKQAHQLVQQANALVEQNIAVLPPCPAQQNLGQISFSIVEAMMAMRSDALFPHSTSDGNDTPF